MVNPKAFVKELKTHDINKVITVPCSIFKDLIAYIENTEELKLIIPSNEAIAMALAAGDYLATEKIPVVMVQNSGLNNTLNSLTSLNFQYKIPIVYIISWRGEPLKTDAEEHNFMGANLLQILDTYQVPYSLLGTDYPEKINWAISTARESERPVALIMKNEFIDYYPRVNKKQNNNILDKWQAIDSIVDSQEDSIYVSTTGLISRALFNILKNKNKEDGRAFYMIGSMGHALGIGESIAAALPKAKVIVLDGDGGALMHLSSMASVAKDKPKNLIHIILDNQTYNSTGGQATLSKNISFKKIGCGFKYKVSNIKNKEELIKAMNDSQMIGPTLIHVSINTSEKEGNEIQRINFSSEEIKKRFQKYIERFK